MFFPSGAGITPLPFELNVSVLIVFASSFPWSRRPQKQHGELEARQAFDLTARLCSFPGRGDRVDEFFFDALPHDLFCLRSGQGRLGVGCFP